MNENLYGFICGKISSRDLSVEETKILCKRHKVSYKKLLEYMAKNINNLPNNFKEKFFAPEEEVKEAKKLKGIRSYFTSDEELLDASKYVYEYCKLKGKIAGCREISNKQNIPFKRVCDIFDYYDIRFGNNNKEKIDIDVVNNKEYSEQELEVFNLFEKLLLISKEDTLKLVECYKNNKCDLKNIRSNSYEFSRRFNNSEEIQKDIIEKVSIIRSYLQREKFESNDNQEKVILKNIKLANEVIYCFIESKLSLNYFCEIMNIDIKKMFNFAKIVKETNESLYNSYAEIYDKENNYIINEVQKLLEYLRNGFYNNEFTLIDYYQNIGMPYSELLQNVSRIRDNISEDDYNLIKRFVNFNKSCVADSKSFRNAIFNEGYYYIVDGEHKELTNEEKELIIEYLSSKYIPVNRINFRIVLKRYINGELVLGNEEPEMVR